jgi:hypothetical protein
MELQGLLPWSQEPDTKHYPKPDESVDICEPNFLKKKFCV